MRRWISAFKWLLGLLLLAGVGLGTWVLMGGPDVAADRDHARLTHWFLQTTRERAVSRRADELRLPGLEPLAGTELLTAVASYEDMCAACHAPPGGAPTALARGLNPPAPDLAQIARKRSAAELFWVTRHGIRMTGMPAWGPTHSDAELLPLVALMKQFPEFADGEYAELLAEAKAAGIEHHHDHDHGHHHDHDHGHDHDHDHDHGHDHDSGEHTYPEPSDAREHAHDHRGSGRSG